MNKILSSSKESEKSFFKKMRDIFVGTINSIKGRSKKFKKMDWPYLANTNLEVGLNHLEQGNIGDAIFRFKMINKYMGNDEQKSEANYWLGWCYLLQKKQAEALQYFQLSDNAEHMYDFVSNIKDIDEVPLEIFAIRKDIDSVKFVEKFSDKAVNIPELIVKLFLKQADLPDIYQVLELENGIGLLSNEIKLRLQGDFDFIATETSAKFIEMQDQLFPEKKWPDQMINEAAEDYLMDCQDKYHVVFSCDGFSHDANLEDIFVDIYDTLSRKGYLVFAIRNSDQVEFSEELFEFSYPVDYIKNLLENCNFKILSCEQFALENENKYSIFICRK